jgi:hypothetical protein
MDMDRGAAVALLPPALLPSLIPKTILAGQGGLLVFAWVNFL